MKSLAHHGWNKIRMVELLNRPYQRRVLWFVKSTVIIGKTLVDWEAMKSALYSFYRSSGPANLSTSGLLPPFIPHVFNSLEYLFHLPNPAIRLMNLLCDVHGRSDTGNRQEKQNSKVRQYSYCLLLFCGFMKCPCNCRLPDVNYDMRLSFKDQRKGTQPILSYCQTCSRACFMCHINKGT